MSESFAVECVSPSWRAPALYLDAPDVAQARRRLPSAPLQSVKTDATPMPSETPTAVESDSRVGQITDWRRVVPGAFALEFSSICEELFVALAARSPRGLASLLTTEGLLDNAELSLAAEAFGRAEDLTLVRQTLVPLLKHKSALVREGAIYGLAELGFEDVRVAIEATAKGDAHAGVRRAAGAVLAGWQEQSRD